MKKNKILCILHRSPPMHGAAMVGDFVATSEKLNERFDCKFITIKSSDTLADIGLINHKKVYYAIELFFKVIFSLFVFRPQKIYFTASVRGVAFYRDLFISLSWKLYKLFTPVSIYYHYHTKGVDKFVSNSVLNLNLTRFFLKNVTLIVLTPLLTIDFNKVKTFKKILYLSNGVKNPLSNIDFNALLDVKFMKASTLHVLYLSNMIKSKGYYEVLKLAKISNDKSIQFHFAGGWQSDIDKKLFFSFVEKHGLGDNVTFHGFVNGYEKDALLKKASFLVFPTKYESESFGLVIIEALSYGVPIIATDEGSIPYIVDEQCGIVINDLEKLPDALNKAMNLFLNRKSAVYCRERYLDNFSLEQFEDNLLEVLK
jgi:glycosyltransferase involved in cell wall biosynthesis